MVRVASMPEAGAVARIYDWGIILPLLPWAALLDRAAVVVERHRA